MLRNATLRQSFAFGSLFLAMVPLWSACSSTVEGTGGDLTETGGDASVGGTSSGGSSDGGNSSGGSSDGGSAGSSTGGSSDGGSSAGGASTGGASTGGASTGGAATGGASTGGNGTGGDSGPTPPSCEDLAANCGPDDTDSCCSSIALDSDPFPMGRSTSGTDAAASGEADEAPEHTATPLAIRLDKYEVSVGRFRKFVEGYPANKPAEGDGEHPGQGSSGWKSDWDAELPETQDDLTFDVGPGCGSRATWFDDPVEVSAYGNTELRPMTCVSWYLAFAFCAWDGGFLPSEADWEFAAAGGSENRLYPWGDDAPTKDLAAFDCKYDGVTPDCGWSTPNDPWSDLTPVGTISGGKGRFGHFDLAGNVEEWVMDGYSDTYYASIPETGCSNCINLTDTTERVLRGGSFWSEAIDIRAAARRAANPSSAGLDNDIDGDVGFRCARPQ